MSKKNHRKRLVDPKKRRSREQQSNLLTMSGNANASKSNTRQEKAIILNPKAMSSLNLNQRSQIR